MSDIEHVENGKICPMCGAVAQRNAFRCVHCGECFAEPLRIAAAKNRLAQAGFFVSLLGSSGAIVVGPFGETINFIGAGFAFLTLPGIVLSAMGFRQSPSRLAFWGLVIGIAGALYIPTICLALFRGLPQ